MTLTLTALGQQLRSGALSSRRLIESQLDRVQRSNASINAIVSIDSDRALAQADYWDRQIATGQSIPALAGIPISVKDNLCSKVGVTSCGSRMLRDFRSPYDAHVVERLESSGAILFGKTNLDEFTMGGSTETSVFGPSRNPWDLQRTCGGSSGGSAASVAAGLVPASLGTDTGGSIRQPAAFCGVCGLKPTYGRVSRWGLISYASSLDTAGVFAQSVEDIALVLQAIAGHDPRDSTSLPHDVPDYLAAVRQDHGIQGTRIGVIRDQIESPGLDPQVRSSLLEAVEAYRRLGAQIVDVQMPHSKYSIATYYIIAPCEASSNLARYDGVHYGFRSAAKTASTLDRMIEQTRSEGFGPEVQRRILLGTYALSAGYYDAYYLQALKVRRLIRQDYDDAFANVDVLLGPTTPQPAFRLGEKINDPIQLYLQDLFTVGANLAGIPALSIPIAPGPEGLPIGMQLQAPVLAEAKLLSIAAAYHRATEYQPKLPAAFEDPTS
ncbi:MAG: Asp-tRNA(Asn)/Glu-tRNA(Gln) amidotransferase subunit GatA [Pirellula sp.]|jgi:aspartyl-tRNA(Asn)/glutamyl-tRNA(Gln) amidotransferase subunit A|nr:Asp-tRNA(Asn)/Glu-tRNA(Gln) amidotransferase subunit GatA [Pirellula sp.]